MSRTRRECKYLIAQHEDFDHAALSEPTVSPVFGLLHLLIKQVADQIGISDASCSYPRSQHREPGAPGWSGRFHTLRYESPARGAVIDGAVWLSLCHRFDDAGICHRLIGNPCFSTRRSAYSVPSLLLGLIESAIDAVDEFARAFLRKQSGNSDAYRNQDRPAALARDCFLPDGSSQPLGQDFSAGGIGIGRYHQYLVAPIADGNIRGS